MELAVCYYPEQIELKTQSSSKSRTAPTTEFASNSNNNREAIYEQIKCDLALMKKVGITWVRVGEFMWSTYERRRAKFDWQLLDRVLDEAAKLDLKIILCTPTATPPKWLIDENPGQILPCDENGNRRQFGSRRHYSFASKVYLREAERIVTLLCERYSGHDALGAWQTDNEYGCHQTTLCYASFTLEAFRTWLKAKYKNIEKLNDDWGNAFWSQTYNTFDEIELPSRTVAQKNPAHMLAFRTFSSAQVKKFNALQCKIIRSYRDKDNLAKPIIHNFMGGETGFDHYQISADLDIAAWDNYPLGYLSEISLNTNNEGSTRADQEYFFDKGDPDFSALHHDLYRSMGRLGWWVMELQPGPVNWGHYNPIPYRSREVPTRSAQRMWTWEAFAHGADVVSFFRYRQNRKAQEQYHSALLYSDDTPTQTLADIEHLSKELSLVKKATENSNNSTTGLTSARSKVAIVYDYPSSWAYQITPQGAGYNFLKETYKWYSGLRTLGVDVDFLSPAKLTVPGSIEHLTEYNVVILPSNAIITPECSALLDQFVKKTGGILIVGARSGSLDEENNLAPNLPPGLLQDLMGVRTPMAATLPPAIDYPIRFEEATLFAQNRPNALHLEGKPLATHLTMTSWIEKCIIPSDEPSNKKENHTLQIIARFMNGDPAITVNHHHHETNSVHNTHPKHNVFTGSCYNFHGLPSRELIVYFLNTLFNDNTAKINDNSLNSNTGNKIREILALRRESRLAESFFPLPKGIRISFRNGLYFACNYSKEDVILPILPPDNNSNTNRNSNAAHFDIKWIIGNEKLCAGDVSIWNVSN
ncbi:beta-galactosidase [Spirochaetota bacterium]|nr:beta-galactosidase [Spirochaetota bacterium]